MGNDSVKEEMKSKGTELVRQGFGEESLQMRGGETASSAVAAQAQAMIQARYIYAERHPRNWLEVRQDLKDECRRPEFANNKSAIYHKPIGQGVEGLGIRFVEVALRHMKNVLIEAPTVYEDDKSRIVRVVVTDLESNTTHYQDVVVQKTVERKKAEEGTFLSVRKNSYGDLVYLVQATDDELQNKEAALISKALRRQGLRIIPGDLQDECEAIIREIRKNKAAEDPKAEAKNIADAFAGLKVKVTDLEAWLEHSLEQCNPDELVKLRNLYGALADNETTWKAVMENKRSQEESPENGKAAAPARGVEALKEKAKEKAQTATAPAAAETKPAEPAKAASEPAAAKEPETPAPAAAVVEEKPAAEPAKAEPAAAAAAPAGGKGLVIRKIQFPAVLTQGPDDLPVPEEITEACKAEAKRLSQPLDKLSPHWLQTPFDKLNAEAVECLTKALQTIPTGK